MLKKLSQLGAAASTSLGALALAATPAFAAVSLGEEVSPGAGFASNFGSLINGVLSFVMVIAALLVFLYLIMGGIEWITSGGDKSKTEGARNKITAAVIGLVILAASYAILLIVLNFLGFDSLGAVFSNVQSINE